MRTIGDGFAKLRVARANAILNALRSARIPRRPREARPQRGPRLGAASACCPEQVPQPRRESSPPGPVELLQAKGLLASLISQMVGKNGATL
jgi:hypothetical protein